MDVGALCRRAPPGPIVLRAGGVFGPESASPVARLVKID